MASAEKHLANVSAEFEAWRLGGFSAKDSQSGDGSGGEDGV